jgi:D-sedoheptulose 7-phosphate isomerase
MTSFTKELQEHAEVLSLMPSLEPAAIAAAGMIAECMREGGKLMLIGNGGSAADSQHLAAEFVGRFINDRRALPAIALTVDSSALTCVANDYGYDQVFSRQVEGLANEGDALLAISTSGNSISILKAIEAAKSRGVRIITMLGRGGGKAKGLADCEIIVPSSSTARIQEMHIFVGHFICGEVERILL